MIDKMQDVNVRLEYKENGYIENILYNYYYLLDKLQFLQEEHKRISDKINDLTLPNSPQGKGEEDAKLGITGNGCSDTYVKPTTHINAMIHEESGIYEDIERVKRAIRSLEKNEKVKNRLNILAPNELKLIEERFKYRRSLEKIACDYGVTKMAMSYKFQALVQKMKEVEYSND